MFDEEEWYGSGKIGMLNRDKQETTDILDTSSTKIFKRRNNI